MQVSNKLKTSLKDWNVKLSSLSLSLTLRAASFMWWMFFFSLGVLKLAVRPLFSFLQLSPLISARPKLFLGFSSYGLNPKCKHIHAFVWIFILAFQFLPKSVKCSRLSVTIIFLIKSKSLTNIEGYVPDQNTPYLVKQARFKWRQH